ncbi:Cys-Gln thioester bond-forming surface protein [Streptomyces sp. URMC 123]|uniref:Cys-Gln thioester bond-forming surface protein n=1 Tax=Streptomyces sp. URMC 123 TaxID=3423403 RepID=UPI003F1A8FE6
MISLRRRPGPARCAAAVLASGLLAAGAIAAAAPAAADDALPNPGGAEATLNGLKLADRAVITDGGKRQEVGAGLFEMAVEGGGTLQTYCVDVHNPTQRQAKYREAPWSASSLQGNIDAGKIRWILQHSFPQVNDLTALAAKAESGPLTERTAAAGTQVAIWRHSDHANVEALDPAAEKLADYLEKSAQSLEEPKASLSLDRSAVSGRPGSRLGPVTVRTDARSVSVAPSSAAAGSGVKVVGADGKPVTTAVDGSKLFFDVPAKAPDGSASLTLQAATTIPVGRVLVSDTKSQTQILAGSSQSTVSATATANWAGKGPVPALSAERNCAKGGVDLTAANKGDQPFTFELKGVRYSVPAGRTETIHLPVPEDQAYSFTINGPGGFRKTFSGIMDCKTTGAGGLAALNQPRPASAGGSTAGSAGAQPVGVDLAATGGSSATPVIASVAVGLVALGGATVFLLRRKGTQSSAE